MIIFRLVSENWSLEWITIATDMLIQKNSQVSIRLFCTFNARKLFSKRACALSALNMHSNALNVFNRLKRLDIGLNV